MDLLRRFRWQLVALLVFQVACAEAPIGITPLLAQDLSGREQDLTSRVEVKVPNSLTYSGKSTYSINVTIKNPARRALRGAIFLLIENTNLPSLSVLTPDGTTADDQPFFVFVKGDDQLGAQSTAGPRKILFAAKDRLTTRERRQFQMRFKVVRRDVRDLPIRSADEAKATEKKRVAKTKPRKSEDQTNIGPIGLSRDARPNSRTRPSEFPYPSERELERVMKIQDRFTEKLLPKEGVVGTATGLDAKGRPEIKVFTARAGIEGIPQDFEGVSIQREVTGELFARPTDDSSGNPRGRFSRPSPIGVSGGNSRGCSAGTIGCRVRGSDGTLYALSNNHVFALSNKGEFGDGICQPGKADTRCRSSEKNLLGNLMNFIPLRFDAPDNRIDAAIATVAPGMLGTSTPSSGYGTPSSTPQSPRILVRVQKFGRTTGLTKGRIRGINATVYVGYRARPARFVDQILVRGDTSGFIEGGDSGSLLVSEDGNHPVGLLFAGSRGGKTGIASPIQFVLDAFNVSVDSGSSDSVKSGGADGRNAIDLVRRRRRVIKPAKVLGSIGRPVRSRDGNNSNPSGANGKQEIENSKGRRTRNLPTKGGSRGGT